MVRILLIVVHTIYLKFLNFGRYNDFRHLFRFSLGKPGNDIKGKRDCCWISLVDTNIGSQEEGEFGNFVISSSVFHGDRGSCRCLKNCSFSFSVLTKGVSEPLIYWKTDDCTNDIVKITVGYLVKLKFHTEDLCMVYQFRHIIVLPQVWFSLWRSKNRTNTECYLVTFIGSDFPCYLLSIAYSSLSCLEI